MTIKEIAKEYIDYFETGERNNGNTFWKMKEDRPEKLYELVREAHGGMLPCDYRYEYTLEALEALSDHDVPEEAIHNIEPDIYDDDLLKWSASNLNRTEYVDEAMIEMKCKDLISALSWGQYKERSEVFYSVLSSLQDIAEEREAA